MSCYYLVTVKFSEGNEVLLGEFTFISEALNFIEEFERVIRLYGNLTSVEEFKIIPLQEENKMEENI